VKAQALVAELWSRHDCAVLLVTHDVEESLRLADRVLVMDGGGIAHEIRVDLPRPREVGDPRFVDLRVQLLTWLGVSA
jgi:sulfonate transport system ATP-binding protein